MTTPQLERLTQYCQRLRLYRVEAELATLLEQAAKRDLAYSDFPRRGPGPRVPLQTGETPCHADQHGALPLSEDARGLRVEVSTLDRSQGDQGARHRPRGGQDTSRGGPRAQGVRTRAPDDVYHRGADFSATEQVRLSVKSIPLAPRSADSLEHLLRSSHSGFAYSLRAVVGDSATFSELWARAVRGEPAPAPLPRIAFDRDMVIVAAMGQQPGTGAGIRIDSVAGSRRVCANTYPPWRQEADSSPRHGTVTAPRCCHDPCRAAPV